MRRTALVIGVATLLAVAGCGGNATPSSGVSTTQLRSSSALAAASPSAGSSAAPSPEASAAASPDASASTSASASPPAPTPTPSPTPKPTAAPVPNCTSANLTAKVTGWQGAMGSQIATVKVTNTSATTCRLRGSARLQLVDAAGSILIDSKTMGASGLPHVSPGDKLWTMGHLGWVTTMVQVSNYCGAITPVDPTTIALYLPSSGGRIVAAAGPGGSVPGCLGNPGDTGSIQMNGWVH
jgi:hypothetical protein